MKSFKHKLLVIAISLIPFVSIFLTPELLHTHDGPMHLARVPAYLKALEGGQIIPRWAADLNYTYGMPLFNFYYHLPYLLGAVFVSLGANLVLSFKLSLLVSFVLSGYFMYVFARSFFKNESAALVATVLYQFAPFHMVDLVVRGDPGETLAMMFLPLILYAIHRGFEQKQTWMNISLISLVMALLVISHSAVSLMYTAVIAAFIIWFSPTITKTVGACIGVLGGLMLSAFYWLPVLVERRYTYGDLFMKDMYTSHFVPFVRFFIPNLTNSSSLQTGGVDTSFGLVQTIMMLIGLWGLAAWKHKNRTVSAGLRFAVVTITGALFFMTPVSSFLWQRVSILRAFQFPWRFLVIPVFSLAFLGGIVVKRYTLRPLAAWAILITVVATSFVYWRPPLGFDRVADESFFWNYPLDTTYFGETNLVWSAGHASDYPKRPFEVIDGKGSITKPVKRSIRHTFVVNAQTDVRIADNTQYYPGWRVYDGNAKIPIEFQDPNHRGIITFRLPEGTHHIVITFGETPLRAFADGISAVTLAACIGLWIFYKKRAYSA